MAFFSAHAVAGSAAHTAAHSASHSAAHGWTVRLVTLAVWAAWAGSVTYWVLQWPQAGAVRDGVVTPVASADGQMAAPAAASLMRALGATATERTLAPALSSRLSLVGVVRAEFLRARNFDYVRAARALGASDASIMFRHVLPNAMVATLTFMPFILSGSVVALTSLDFLGFGLPPGSASLGELLGQGKSNLNAPWLGLTAFFTLAIMLSLLVFIGEAARDAFDPRKTFRIEIDP
jgi:hypothetical protein